jgi:hypothetical protein
VTVQVDHARQPGHRRAEAALWRAAKARRLPYVNSQPFEIQNIL